MSKHIIIRVVPRRRSGRRDAEEEKRRRSPLVDFHHQSRKSLVVVFCVVVVVLASKRFSLIKIRIDFDRSRKRKKQNTNEATRDDIITRTHLSTISVRTAAARARLPACTRPTSESSVCLSPARECQCSPPAGPRTTTMRSADRAREAA